MNLTEEAKEKIKQCPHDSFNGGTLQCCDGCGHPRLYIQGFEDALRSQWVRIEDGLPEKDGLYDWTIEYSVDGERVVDRRYFDNHMRERIDRQLAGDPYGVKLIAWHPILVPYQQEETSDATA